MLTNDAADPRSGTWHWVALTSMLAGVIHLAVLPARLEEGSALWPFFIVVGCFQLAFAGAVLRRSTVSLALAGIMVNLGVVLLHGAHRAIGTPEAEPALLSLERGAHGIHGTHQVEAAWPADLVATGMGLAAVWLLVAMLPSRRRRRAVDLVMIAGAGLWAVHLARALG